MAGQVRDRFPFSTLNTLVLSPISARLLPVNLGWRIKIRSDAATTGIPFASAKAICLHLPYGIHMEIIRIKIQLKGTVSSGRYSKA